MSTEPETNALTQRPSEAIALVEAQKRQAQLMAASNFLPKCYRGNPADCLIAIQWAHRTGRDPMELLQNSYVVHGTPGLYGRYMLALANRAGVFDKRIRFVTSGDYEDMVVTAIGLIDGDEYTASASMQMARDEGWNKNPKYKGAFREIMLRWRALAILIRFTCPEVLLGMYTVEELEDQRWADARVAEPVNPAVEALARDIAGVTEDEPTPDPEEEPVATEIIDAKGEVVGPPDPEDVDLFRDLGGES